MAAGAAGGGPGDPGGLPGGSLPHRDPLGPPHHGPVRPGDGGGPPVVVKNPPPRDLRLGRVSRIIYSYFLFN